MMMPLARKRPEKINRSEKRARRTRQKLVNAAREVFAERGIDLATIDEITGRADVGKGTFYYYFSDKNEVVAELISDVLRNLDELMEKRCADSHNLHDLMDQLIGAHIEFFSTRWEDFVLYYQGRADLKLKENYEGIEKPFLTYLESIERLIASMLQVGVSKAALRRVGCAVAGFLSGYYSFAVIASEDADIDQTFRDLRTALVSALTRFVNEALEQKTDQSRQPRLFEDRSV